MTLSVQKLSASLQSVCLCWTNRLCVASLGLMNGRNTCGFRKAICSPAARPQLDHHLTATLKRKLCPLPSRPLHTALPLCFLFSFLFLHLLLHKTSSEVGHRHLSCIDAVNYVSSVAGSSLLLCVWHSKWEILGSLAKLSANSLHFSFLPGSRSQEPPTPTPPPQRKPLFFSLCSLSQRPFALNLLTLNWEPKQNTTQELLCSRHPSPISSLSKASAAQVSGGTEPSGL